jgi:hypothetical protein
MANADMSTFEVKYKLFYCVSYEDEEAISTS